MTNRIAPGATLLLERLEVFHFGLRRPQPEDTIRIWQLDLGWMTILWTKHSVIHLLTLSRALGLQEGIAQERERLTGFTKGV